MIFGARASSGPSDGRVSGALVPIRSHAMTAINNDLRSLGHPSLHRSEKHVEMISACKLFRAGHECIVQSRLSHGARRLPNDEMTS